MKSDSKRTSLFSVVVCVVLFGFFFLVVGCVWVFCLFVCLIVLVVWGCCFLFGHVDV